MTSVYQCIFFQDARHVNPHGKGQRSVRTFTSTWGFSFCFLVPHRMISADIRNLNLLPGLFISNHNSQTFTLFYFLNCFLLHQHDRRHIWHIWHIWRHTVLRTTTATCVHYKTRWAESQQATANRRAAFEQKQINHVYVGTIYTLGLSVDYYLPYFLIHLSIQWSWWYTALELLN